MNYTPSRLGYEGAATDVAVVRLKALGWGAKRIAGRARLCAEQGAALAAERALAADGDAVAPEMLDGLASWLAERFRRHVGNSDVVRQELAAHPMIPGIRFRPVTNLGPAREP